MDLCGENLGMIISSTNPDLELKKKHVEISYHKLQDSSGVGIINPIKVCTTVNPSNILINIMLVGTRSFSECIIWS